MNWDIKNSCSVCIHITTLKKKKKKNKYKENSIVIKI